MDKRVNDLGPIIEKILPEVDGVLGLKTGPGGIVAPYLFVKERPEELAISGNLAQRAVARYHQD